MAASKHNHYHVPDEHGFGQLFKSVYARLCLFAYKMVMDKQTAEDLVQDCFAELWKKRKNVDWSMDIIPYLYGMVRFSAYHFLRDKKSLAPTLLDTEITDEENVLRYMIEAETMHEIYLAIDKLPVRCGNIFKALFIEGKRISEVSADQQLTESTVRSHKAAALAILRHRLVMYSAVLSHFTLTILAR